MKTKTTSMRINPILYRKFKVACAVGGRQVSAVVVELMETYIKEQGVNADINQDF